MEFAFIKMLQRVALAIANCPDSAIGVTHTEITLQLPNSEIRNFLLAVYQNQLAYEAANTNEENHHA